MIKLEEVRALESGQFILDCPRIEIEAKNKLRSEVYEGPGFIQQTNDGKFKFKVYNQKKVQSSIFPSVWEASKEGDIVSDEENYKITAYDYAGRVWQSKTLDLNIVKYGSKPKMELLLRGSVQSLTSIEMDNNIKGNYIQFILFDLSKFPFTEYRKEKTETDDKIIRYKSHEIVDYSDSEFIINAEKTDQLVNLKITPIKKTIHSNSYMRVIESLNFILGREINPQIIFTRMHNNLTTTICCKQDEPGDIDSPLHFRSSPNEKSKQVWRIFSNFLNKIWRFKEKYYSPLGEETNLVIESWASSFSVQCLIVSVCIEGLLKKFYKPKLSEYFQPKEEITAKKMLKLLIKKKLITKYQFKMWGALRNKEAHGERESKKGFQKQLWRYDEVLELFYRLILNYIQYSGPITTYGKDKYRKEIFKYIKFT